MGNIQAVCFDMDGTLVDSEHLTDAAVSSILARHGVALSVETSRFHGVTWSEIARTLQDLAPVLAALPLATQLQTEFHRHLVETAPPVIAGAPEAVVAAAQRVSTALVSSSNRASVTHVLTRLGLTEHLPIRVCAEDCQRSKPDPQCYQQAAQQLGVNSANCLVFEDSVAGLTAARAAGMRTIAIRPPDSPPVTADRVIADFTELPKHFFELVGTS